MAKKSVSDKKHVAASGGENQTLHLPDFSDPYLRALHLCFHFPIAIPREPLEGDARFGTGSWLHVVVGVASKGSRPRTHVHFDIVKSFETKRDAAPSNTLSELLASIVPFWGMSEMAYLAAEYLVPLDALPRRGMIDAFMGLSTKAGGTNLAFTGATMKIQDENLDELSWKLTADGKSVKIELDMGTESTVGSDCILQAETIAKEALKRLVLDGDRPNE